MVSRKFTVGLQDFAKALNLFIRLFFPFIESGMYKVNN